LLLTKLGIPFAAMSTNRYSRFQNESSENSHARISGSGIYKTSDSYDLRNKDNKYEKESVLNWSDQKIDEEYNQYQDNLDRNFTSRKRIHSNGEEIFRHSRNYQESSGKKPAKISRMSKPKQQETDPAVLARREKQISYGKNTVAYTNYLEAFPKNKRSRFHPTTPNKNAKASRRHWDSRIKTWRKALHDVEGYRKSEENKFIDSMDAKKKKNIQLKDGEKQILRSIFGSDSKASAAENLNDELEVKLEREIKEEDRPIKEEPVVKDEVEREDSRRRRNCNSDSESDDDLIFLDDDEGF